MKKSLLSISVAVAMSLATTQLYAHETVPRKLASKQTTQSLSSILAAMPEKTKARYDARHPQQTLDFFGIKPGMTVVEALPGGGWYSKVLLPYLGHRGNLVGADYAMDMYPKFGFFNQKDLDAKKTWVKDWSADAKSWRTNDSASVKAFQFGSMPKMVEGKADAVVFIRALHNLARFEKDGGYLTAALKDTYTALKPGGIVGVVQHMAPESASDEWANGSRGYLKKSFLIARMEKAGFEFVDSSDININPKDQPTEKDIVWRLPPAFATSNKDKKMIEQYQAVGESTRMTLRFRKPTQ